MTVPVIRRSLLMWTILMLMALIIPTSVQLCQQWQKFNRAFEYVEQQVAYRLTQNAAVLPLISPGSNAAELNHKFPQIVAIESLPDSTEMDHRITPDGKGRYWLNNRWQKVRELVDLQPVVAAALQHQPFHRLTLNWQNTVLFSVGSSKVRGLWHWSATFSQEIQPFTLTASASPQWQAIKVWPALLLAILATALSLLLHQFQRQRQADRRAQFYQDSRLNALGEITTGMVHEINQPLTAIMNWLQGARLLLAKGDLALLPDALDKALEQTQRIALLLQRFREHLEQREVVLNAVDVKQTWLRVEDLLGREIREGNIVIQRHFGPHPIVVNADPLWLEQVLHNLLSNAIQAQNQQKKGWVQIRCRTEGNHVLVTLTDGGTGFSKEALEQALMPFFTTRNDGIGLGMTLAETLVLRMNGKITLSNHADGGACIQLQFQTGEPK